MSRWLHDDWTGAAHRRLRGNADAANRLAIVLGPVQSAIRVVDPRRPATRVLWATVESGRSQSYTDFRGGEIRINPLPVLEDRLSPEEQVDVSIFQALHEAGHSRDTRALWYSTLLRTVEGREEPAFEPLRVATWLLNIAEDVRSEGNTQAEWPGFRGYFERGLDWLWSEQARREGFELPTGPGHTVVDRLRVAFIGARFRDRVDTPVDEALAAEYDWWAAWQADHTAGRATPAETVGRGLDRIGQDPGAKREMEAEAEADRKAREEGEQARRQLQRLAEQGFEGLEVCAVDALGPSELDADTGAEVEQLVREGMVAVTPIIKSRGAKQPQMRYRRPLETPESRRQFIGRPDPVTEAMRSALVFRQERPLADLKLQRSGEVDDEELWRWSTGDDRVFTERAIESRPDTALGMLVDVSGSMQSHTGGESKLRTAQRLAQILLAAALDTEGLTPYVWAHTGDTEMGDGSDTFEVWAPGDPVTRLGLIGSIQNGNNYDGHAIALVADRMRQMEQPQKVLLVLSDGYPAGDGYGGAQAQQHVRQVCRWAEGQGVTVIQIAIDQSLRPVDQAAMFGDGNFVLYTSDRQVPRDLVRILSRYAR